jgi:hypothetical protein
MGVSEGVFLKRNREIKMPTPQLPTSVQFHYIKGNLFRVIHSEGAIGGVTPNRDIFVSLFNERAALPQLIEFEVLPEGKLGKEIKRVGKEGIVREMEIGILMNANSAKNLADFLLSQVKLLEESEPASKDDSISTERE